jgi:hypothetical protein
MGNQNMTDFEHYRLNGPEDTSPYSPYGDEHFFGGDNVEHWRYYIGTAGCETTVYITGLKENHEHNAKVAATVRTAGLTGHTLERAISLLADIKRAAEGEEAYLPQEVQDEIDELMMVAGVVFGLQANPEEGEGND